LRVLAIFFIGAILLQGACLKIKKEIEQNFNSTKAKEIPSGWIMSSTGRKSLGIWEVTKDKSVLLKYPRGSQKNQFNLLYTKELYFKNGYIEAKIDSVDGHEKNGGIVFRLRDRKNYYMVLLDFIKKELSFFVVKNGKVKKIFHKKVDLKNGWNILKASFCDKDIKIYLNEKESFFIKNDQISHKGGAGIVTMGDSKSAFDDIKIAVYE